MEDGVKAANELQESDRGAMYNSTMEVCNLVKALEIDKEDEKKDKDKKDKKDDDDEEHKESEVDRLKKIKRHQGR